MILMKSGRSSSSNNPTGTRRDGAPPRRERQWWKAEYKGTWTPDPEYKKGRLRFVEKQRRAAFERRLDA